MCRSRYFVHMVLGVLTVLILSGWCDQAQSQPKYPTKPIDIIVPVPPGGAVDGPVRVIAEFLRKKWGVPVNVVNKPGGAGLIGTLEVYRAAPDGYTMLEDALPFSSQMVVTQKSLPFNIMDRTFIAMHSTHAQLMSVPSSSSIRSLKELEIVVKKDPGKFTWASNSGGMGANDWSVFQFLRAIGVDASKTRPVIAQGGSALVTLVAGGHVVFGSASTAAGLPAIQAGTMRVLAVSSKERYEELPNVPTTTEAGYPAVNCIHWNAISGPPGLPSYIFNAWDKALQEAVKDPEVITKIRNVGLKATYTDAAQLRKRVVAEMAELKELYSVKN